MPHSYPSIKHLNFTKSKTRDDKILTEEETNKVLEQELTIQEKLDGYNLGISFENSSRIITHRDSLVDLNSIEAKKIKNWYKLHEDLLLDLCEEKYVLYGEWLYWQHKVKYSRLPSYFLAFAMFDKDENKFLSQDWMEEILEGTDLIKNSVIFKGILTQKEILKLISTSQFGKDQMEGLIINIDNEYFNLETYKLVRDGFLDENEDHWKKTLIHNKSLNHIEKFWNQPNI